MVSDPSWRLGDCSTFDYGGHRLSSRSIAWNATGSFLAVAASDRTTKFCTVDPSGIRETSSIAGHNGPIQRIRFHPRQDHLLCTAASDSSVRLWDVRSSSQKASGQIDIPSGTPPTDISWSSSSSDSTILIVTARDGSIIVYDTRKITTGRGGSNSAVLKIFKESSGLVEACIVSPGGRHLIGAMTTNGQGELKVWEWDCEDASQKYEYPAHTGPIYSLAFSPNGKHLATGGADAVVGLWNVDSMVCTSTIDRCQKFIRSVAFSHDSKLIASSSEEDGIDVALAETGELVGKLSLGRVKGGADEISFHPKAHVLACARCPTMGATPPAVTVARISLSS